MWGGFAHRILKLLETTLYIEKPNYMSGRRERLEPQDTSDISGGTNPSNYTFCTLILNCLLLVNDTWCPKSKSLSRPAKPGPSRKAVFWLCGERRGSGVSAR